MSNTITYGYNFGNPIQWDETKREWFYDNGSENTVENYQKLVCPRCMLHPEENGHDPCIKNLRDVEFACCGHGLNDDVEHAYIKFKNGNVLRFGTTEEILEYVKANGLPAEDRK
jgi:hypothetical protein